MPHVDFEKRAIYGVIVMSVGRAFGHCGVDAKTLEQFLTQVNGQKIRGREDHPDKPEFGEAPLTKKVSDLRGYFHSFRIDGDRLVADFQALSESAGGEETTRILRKAQEAPEIFGVSPIFFGNPQEGMARVTKVVAIDFVDIPAGANGTQQLFSAESEHALGFEEEMRLIRRFTENRSVRFCFFANDQKQFLDSPESWQYRAVLKDYLAGHAKAKGAK